MEEFRTVSSTPGAISTGGGTVSNMTSDTPEDPSVPRKGWIDYLRFRFTPGWLHGAMLVSILFSAVYLVVISVWMFLNVGFVHRERPHVESSGIFDYALAFAPGSPAPYHLMREFSSAADSVAYVAIVSKVVGGAEMDFRFNLSAFRDEVRNASIASGVLGASGADPDMADWRSVFDVIQRDFCAGVGTDEVEKCRVDTMHSEYGTRKTVSDSILQRPGWAGVAYGLSSVVWAMGATQFSLAAGSFGMLCSSLASVVCQFLVLGYAEIDGTLHFVAALGLMVSHFFLHLFVVWFMWDRYFPDKMQVYQLSVLFYVLLIAVATGFYMHDSRQAQDVYSIMEFCAVWYGTLMQVFFSWAWFYAIRNPVSDAELAAIRANRSRGRHVYERLKVMGVRTPGTPRNGVWPRLRSGRDDAI